MYVWAEVRPFARGRALHGLSAVARLDVALDRRASRGRTQVEFGMRNVFDAQYALVEGFPEPGRTLLLSLVYRDR